MSNQFKTLFKNLSKTLDVVEFKDSAYNFAKVVIASVNAFEEANHIKYYNNLVNKQS